MEDVNNLELAEHDTVMDGAYNPIAIVWHAEAHGAKVSLRTVDLEASYWVSPIKTMRTRGVALVDSSGAMVRHTVVNR